MSVPQSLPAPGYPTGLPTPDDDSVAHSRRVEQHLLEAIKGIPDGFLPFEAWMAEILYAPGLGYTPPAIPNSAALCLQATSPPHPR